MKTTKQCEDGHTCAAALNRGLDSILDPPPSTPREQAAGLINSAIEHIERSHNHVIVALCNVAECEGLSHAKEDLKIACSCQRTAIEKLQATLDKLEGLK